MYPGRLFRLGAARSRPVVMGQIGYQYGYIGYNATVMNTVLVLLVILVYLIQFSGDRIVRAVTHK
jgi:D-methionine transport system permease protein